MDFWDVAKLMWRRWSVTVPALLITVVATVWVAVTVEPDYQVTGHVAVVGPSIQRTAGDSDVTRVNPWSSEALADAATIRLQGKALADELAAEGFGGSWEAGVTGRLPVIRIEVVAERPEYAQATLERLREVIDEEVAGLQAQHNVAPEEQITTVSYDGGESVEPVTGKVKRAIMVVFAAGLIITVGLAVAVDAMARRRQAKGAEPSAPGPVASEVRPRYQFGSQPEKAAATAATFSPGPLAGRTNGQEHDATSVLDSPVRVDYSNSNEPTSPAPASAPPIGDDSTIVLPLSYADPLRRQKTQDSELPTQARTS